MVELGGELGPWGTGSSRVCSVLHWKAGRRSAQHTMSLTLTQTLILWCVGGGIGLGIELAIGALEVPASVRFYEAGRRLAQHTMSLTLTQTLILILWCVCPHCLGKGGWTTAAFCI